MPYAYTAHNAYALPINTYRYNAHVLWKLTYLWNMRISFGHWFSRAKRKPSTRRTKRSISVRCPCAIGVLMNHTGRRCQPTRTPGEPAKMAYVSLFLWSTNVLKGCCSCRVVCHLKTRLRTSRPMKRNTTSTAYNSPIFLSYTRYSRVFLVRSQLTHIVQRR